MGRWFTLKAMEKQRIKWDMEKALILADIMDIQADGEEAGYIFDCLQRAREVEKPGNLSSRVENWFREYMSEDPSAAAPGKREGGL